MPNVNENNGPVVVAVVTLQGFSDMNRSSLGNLGISDMAKLSMSRRSAMISVGQIIPMFVLLLDPKEWARRAGTCCHVGVSAHV